MFNPPRRPQTLILETLINTTLFTPILDTNNLKCYIIVKKVIHSLYLLYQYFYDTFYNMDKQRINKIKIHTLVMLRDKVIKLGTILLDNNFIEEDRTEIERCLEEILMIISEYEQK